MTNNLVPLEEIHQKLKNRYDASGFSPYVIRTDWQIIRRIGVHPALATTQDLEKVVLKATKQSTKANYVSRLRSIYKHLNKMDLVNGNNPAADLPNVKSGRGVPKPITKGEFEKLLAEATQPYRDWFILGGMVGLRAHEVAKIEGADLIEDQGGYSLRVIGKGKTDLVVPVAHQVAETIQKYNTLGPLWEVDPNAFSKRAANEMRRILGPNAKHFHSLRHYFATTMLEKSNGDLLAVRDLMRHSSVATTQVYTQLSQGRTRSLVDLL
jgi:site-specific recombinase XerC